MNKKNPALYILASQRNGTLYIGVTSDLVKRVYQHKNNLIDGFSQDHSIHNLVYYEQYEDMSEAIKREKAMKKWNRDWKLDLIEKNNPNWDDLYETLHS